MLSSIIGSSLQLLTLVSPTEAAMLQLRGQTVGDTVEYAWVHSSVLAPFMSGTFLWPCCKIIRSQDCLLLFSFPFSSRRSSNTRVCRKRKILIAGWDISHFFYPLSVTLNRLLSLQFHFLTQSSVLS